MVAMEFETILIVGEMGGIGCIEVNFGDFLALTPEWGWPAEGGVVVLSTAVGVESLEPLAFYKLIHWRMLGVVSVSHYCFVG